MCKVFVLDTDKRKLDPIHPAQARHLLRDKKAAVFRRLPFTVILKESKPDAVVSTLRLKIDPGAKTTGFTMVNDLTGEVVSALTINPPSLPPMVGASWRFEMRMSYDIAPRF